jgi:hypothetical protein
VKTAGLMLMRGTKRRDQQAVGEIQQHPVVEYFLSYDATGLVVQLTSPQIACLACLVFIHEHGIASAVVNSCALGSRILLHIRQTSCICGRGCRQVSIYQDCQASANL